MADAPVLYQYSKGVKEVDGEVTLDLKNGENTTVLTDLSGNVSVHGYAGSSVINTSNASTTTLLSILTAADKVYMIEAYVTARRTGGSAGAVGDSASFIRIARAKNVGGVLTIPMVQTGFTSKDQSNWNANFDVSGTAVRVRVSGSLNNNVSWKCSYRIWSV